MINNCSGWWGQRKDDAPQRRQETGFLTSVQRSLKDKESTWRDQAGREGPGWQSGTRLAEHGQLGTRGWRDTDSGRPFLFIVENLWINPQLGGSESRN